MKCKMHKSWFDLPPSEQAAICKCFESESEKVQVELQEIWLKLACIIMHDKFGFGEKRCLLFLGHWREMYNKNKALNGKEKQTEFLETEMAKIFKQGGFPDKFIERLKEL